MSHSPTSSTYITSLFERAQSFSDLAEICKSWPPDLHRDLVRQCVQHIQTEIQLDQFFAQQTNVNKSPILFTSPFRIVPLDVICTISSFLGKGSIPSVSLVSKLFHHAVQTIEPKMFVEIDVIQTPFDLASFSCRNDKWTIGASSGLEIGSNWDLIESKMTRVSHCTLYDRIGAKHLRFVQEVVGPRTRKLTIKHKHGPSMKKHIELFPHISSLTIYVSDLLSALRGLSSWELPTTCTRINLRVCCYSRKNYEYQSSSSPASTAATTAPSVPSVQRTIWEDLNWDEEIFGKTLFVENVRLVSELTCVSGVGYDVLDLDALVGVFWRFVAMCDGLVALNMDINDVMLQRNPQAVHSNLKLLRLTSKRSVTPSGVWEMSQSLGLFCPPQLVLDVTVRVGCELQDYHQYFDEISSLLQFGKIVDLTLVFVVDQMWAVIHPDSNLLAPCDVSNAVEIRDGLRNLRTRSSGCSIRYQLLGKASNFQSEVFNQLFNSI